MSDIEISPQFARKCADCLIAGASPSVIAQACAAEGIEFPAAMDAAWSLIRLESSPDLAREIDLDIARFNDLYATCKGLQDTKGAESALKARMRLLVMRDNLK